jgi:hypothetical protein
MIKVHKIINYIIIAIISFSMTGCSKAIDAVKNENEVLVKDEVINELKDSIAKENKPNTTQEAKPENQTLTSPSPDGKYRAEAYGTNTSITAGGLFPYEGIRILNVSNDEVIWQMTGYYTVDFLWSPDCRYVGIYYMARIWGESIIVDINNKKSILLPALNEIAAHYGESVKPQENRPDPYLKISGWKDAETVIVDFQWSKEDGEYFNGQYTFNIKTNTVVYK